MATIRSYRLVSLGFLLAGMLALFLAFFFIWVLAPLAVICAFYVVFVIAEERRKLTNGKLARRKLRRARLDSEAVARERDLERAAAERG